MVRIIAGQVLTGSLFNEPMRVESVQANGPESWVVGLVGTQSERFRRVTLTAEEFERLTILDARYSFDGDGRLLRLGLQAYALGIAYEFDPYFGLSISRVDPLPHQLEAVYDYLLKLARVRFLLADDAGAGKTIMAGLLIRELELRGLAERILIVCPANLAFQWQRELKEKFDTKFLVLKGQDIRDQFGVNQWLDRSRIITSLDLAKRQEILPGLRQVHWDLVIVDEAHRMSAADESHKSLRYRLGSCCAIARTTCSCSRRPRTRAIRRTSASSYSSSTPTPTPMSGPSARRWTAGGRPSTCVVPRRRWSTFPSAGRTAPGPPGRSSPSVSRTRSRSRSTGRSSTSTAT
jgi:hypothetical protein